MKNCDSHLSKVVKQLFDDVPLPPHFDLRFERDALAELQKQRVLSDEEHTRLYYLINEIENANAARWQAIADLARARGLSMFDLAEEWRAASYKALREVWDNDEDAAYDDLSNS